MLQQLSPTVAVATGRFEGEELQTLSRTRNLGKD